MSANTTDGELPHTSSVIIVSVRYLTVRKLRSKIHKRFQVDATIPHGYDGEQGHGHWVSGEWKGRGDSDIQNNPRVYGRGFFFLQAPFFL